MTDKEKILQEIERLIAIEEEETSHLDKISFNSGRWKVLTQLKVFIDSLPEEPTVKGITWEDVNTLESLIYQVHNEYSSIGEKSFGIEVLEKFQGCQDPIEDPASKDLDEDAYIKSSIELPKELTPIWVRICGSRPRKMYRIKKHFYYYNKKLSKNGNYSGISNNVLWKYCKIKGQ